MPGFHSPHPRTFWGGGSGSLLSLWSARMTLFPLGGSRLILRGPFSHPGVFGGSRGSLLLASPEGGPEVSPPHLGPPPTLGGPCHTLGRPLGCPRGFLLPPWSIWSGLGVPFSQSLALGGSRSPVSSPGAWFLLSTWGTLVPTQHWRGSSSPLSTWGALVPAQHSGGAPKVRRQSEALALGGCARRLRSSSRPRAPPSFPSAER